MSFDQRIPAKPGLEETQPVKSASPTSRPRWRRILFAISSMVFAGIIVLLALPTLFFPPSELASPYELFSLAQVSEDLDPARDHLLSALDGIVELYIPEGADLGAGSLVILPRQDDFVPKRLETTAYRMHAVDIFLVRPNGDLVNSIALDQSLLLCFALDDQDLEDREAEVADYFVQWFDEGSVNADWGSLDAVPGWREDQVCGSLRHLSLYALGVIPFHPPTESSEAKDFNQTPTISPTLEVEIEGFAPYGFPSGTATP